MVNTHHIEDAIKNSGLKKAFIAESLGINHNSLRNKITNRTEFKKLEVNALSELLGLDETEKNEIFFAKEGDL